jgi:glutaconate CoA-transferase subunit B
MKLETAHPGVTVEDVQASTGFDLMFSGKAQETERPTVQEITLLRDKIDPKGVLLREGP